MEVFLQNFIPRIAGAVCHFCCDARATQKHHERPQRTHLARRAWRRAWVVDKSTKRVRGGWNDA
eukprot:scaffold3576_cov157-Pinguiococcus_pyrenoidosus.AAC.1